MLGIGIHTRFGIHIDRISILRLFFIILLVTYSILITFPTAAEIFSAPVPFYGKHFLEVVQICVDVITVLAYKIVGGSTTEGDSATLYWACFVYYSRIFRLK